MNFVFLTFLLLLIPCLYISSRYSFLNHPYKVNNSREKFYVRQVPGDGSCLFHSLAACLRFKQIGKHQEFDRDLRQLSYFLRLKAVEILTKENETLHTENGETVLSCDLLNMVANFYNMTPKSYCEHMRHDRTWGGGPEIVALSNYLRRPIHVYVLGVRGIFPRGFEFKACAKFGSPAFKYKSPLYILCADGRFPNLMPGKQKNEGDHFLALFPFNIEHKREGILFFLSRTRNHADAFLSRFLADRRSNLSWIKSNVDKISRNSKFLKPLHDLFIKLTAYNHSNNTRVPEDFRLDHFCEEIKNESTPVDESATMYSSDFPVNILPPISTAAVREFTSTLLNQISDRTQQLLTSASAVGAGFVLDRKANLNVRHAFKSAWNKMKKGKSKSAPAVPKTAFIDDSKVHISMEKDEVEEEIIPGLIQEGDNLVNLKESTNFIDQSLRALGLSKSSSSTNFIDRTPTSSLLSQENQQQEYNASSTPHQGVNHPNRFNAPPASSSATSPASTRCETREKDVHSHTDSATPQSSGDRVAACTYRESSKRGSALHAVSVAERDLG